MKILNKQEFQQTAISYSSGIDFDHFRSSRKNILKNKLRKFVEIERGINREHSLYKTADTEKGRVHNF